MRGDDIRLRLPDRWTTSIVLMLLGSAVAWGGFRLNSYREVPVRVPLRLGTMQSSFVVDVGGTYEIQLQFARGRVSPEVLMDAAEAISPHPLALDLEWQLWRDGVRVQEGSSSDRPASVYGSTTIGRILSAFRASAGARYSLKLSVRNIPAQLVPAIPAIVIAYAPREGLNRMVISVLLILVGGILLTAGVFICMRLWIRTRSTG